MAPKHLLICLLTGTLTSCASGPYKFPAKGCSEKIDPAARSAACQIPDDALAGMSTGELLDAVLKYPYFLTELLASPGIQQGFENLSSRFSGLRTFLEREDAAAELTKKYLSAGLKCPVSGENKPPASSVFEFYYLEIMLAQKEIVSRLSDSQKNRLKDKIAKNRETKRTMKDCFGGGFNTEVMGLLEQAFNDKLEPTP